LSGFLVPFLEGIGLDLLAENLDFVAMWTAEERRDAGIEEFRNLYTRTLALTK
jgi:hypothetical protein